MKTNQSQAAAAIRKELKESFPGIKFSVTSKGYTGGDSVRIGWIDGPKTETVDAIVGKYERGHFDGMNDIYKYDNINKDIPQINYVFTERSLSFEKAKNSADELNEKFGYNIHIIPTEYGWKVENNIFLKNHREYADQVVLRNGREKSYFQLEMESIKQSEQITEELMANETFVSKYRGNKIFNIKTGGKYTFSFGIAKAKLILENIEEIRKFVESNSNTKES